MLTALCQETFPELIAVAKKAPHIIDEDMSLLIPNQSCFFVLLLNKIEGSLSRCFLSKMEIQHVHR
jgi:hypothetical protein